MQISTDKDNKKWLSYKNYPKGNYNNLWLLSYEKFQQNASIIITIDIIAIAIIYLPQLFNNVYLEQLKNLSKYYIFIFLFLILISRISLKRVSHLQVIQVEKNYYPFLVHQLLIFVLLIFTYLKPYLSQ